MRFLAYSLGLSALLQARAAAATPAGEPKFRRVMTVIFENQDLGLTLRQPFFGKLASEGALLDAFEAETHPSEPNYIALTSGDMQGVRDDSDVNLDVRNVVDLLEAKGHSWQVYVESWPGHCYLGSRKGLYARKHNPFVSYTDITGDAARCAHIVDASELQKDVAAGTLPDYSFFVPNMNDDAHDTNVVYADKWYSRTFGPLLDDKRFSTGMLLITTFDESSPSGGNHIYTVLDGKMIPAGSHVTQPTSHYTLLRLVEDNWDLGTLGGHDASAKPLDLPRH